MVGNLLNISAYVGTLNMTRSDRSHLWLKPLLTLRVAAILSMHVI
jgi:hypothetical protein